MRYRKIAPALLQRVTGVTFCNRRPRLDFHYASSATNLARHCDMSRRANSDSCGAADCVSSFAPGSGVDLSAELPNGICRSSRANVAVQGSRPQSELSICSPLLETGWKYCSRRLDANDQRRLSFYADRRAIGYRPRPTPLLYFARALYCDGDPRNDREAGKPIAEMLAAAGGRLIGW